MATGKKIPINRSNKWLDRSDYDLEVQYGREFIESDLNQTVVLYRVDREASQTDALYGEANKSELRYKTPVELKVIGRIMEPENKVYNDNGSLNYLQPGQFIFGLYQAQLDELQCEIVYGDYIGYAVTETEMVFYSVVNPGQVNYDNSHTIFGYLPAFRTITCAPVMDDEFNAI